MLGMTRAAAVCAAIMVGLIGWLAGWMSPDAGERIALAEVLRQTEAADVLHLELIRGDETSEIWIRQPGEVRWEDSPRRYQIARGSRLWRIDADSNQVAVDDSPWFTGAGEPIELVSLLGLTDIDETAFARAVASGVEEYDGRRCAVFRVDVESAAGLLHLTAYADRQTRELCGLIVKDPRSPDAPPVELRLIARDVPFDESLFVVAESLTEDGRIGKVLDAQGIVSLKPVMNRRWTPVVRPVVLKPGDWLRTDVRGANAVRASLTSPVQLTIGPASLVELISPNEARLHQGEVQITVSDGADEAFRLLGPGEASVEVTADGRQIIRVARDESLANVDNPPQWLQGFEGTTNDESLGSLIVNVDGRSEPLSVGYHHVSVEIRDQIARTTIEESFVNHSDARLEGTFHFPLPQDASISGFGMWIGDELIEADIVEKQRAREIYETILREKRDPGLLEWAGGNMFKARVFPIEPHSEKRIKIVYTQVLPLRGNQYRYSYALNSELLRTTPLRELSLDVLVSSALPIADMRCPSHSVRSEHTPHAGRVEFAAQEYTPDRDFEVVVELDRRQSDVVVVPHRRGDDGYFLIQLMPPAAEGNFQREVLPDGQPLDLLLLCDTSASMDSTKRQQQADFVAALLASLGEADRFRLACCDVSTVWGVEEPTQATEETRAVAAEFLAGRVSLGWTDLDQAFAAIEEHIGENTQVLYIGDGVVSTGDADPAAFVNRLHRLFPSILNPPTSSLNRPAFHSVAVGSSYESVVLNGIARLGSGSQRAIGGEQTPQIVALELLNELAQPGLRDINLEFRGLKVAAVYPEVLPNVAAGTQQIIVGRYLPQGERGTAGRGEGERQRGSVVVTGVLNGEPVRYVAQIMLDDAESGNSFIPRLWARGRLDHLLAQGSSQFIQDEIIALSEEFHIITPYTSLLVLESDADRERFGVQRRYEMRDGEQFFAEGRDDATYELVQQQMREAGDWRIALRRQVLAQLAGLGRDRSVFENWGQSPASARLGETRLSTRLFSTSGVQGPDWYAFGRPAEEYGFGDMTRGRERGADFGLLPELRKSDELDSLESFRFKTEGLDEKKSADEYYMGARFQFTDFDGLVPLGEGEMFGGDALWDLAEGANAKRAGLAGVPVLQGRQQMREWAGFEQNFSLKQLSLLGEPVSRGGRLSYSSTPDYLAWVDRLFPVVPAAPVQAASVPAAEWPADVREVTDLIYTMPALREMDGGVEIHTTTESRDPRWDRITALSESLELYSPGAWLTRADGIGPERVVNWCDESQRGVFSATFGGGRVRPAEDTDRALHTVSVIPYAQRPLHEAFPTASAEMESRDENAVVIKLTYRDTDPPGGVRMTVDTAKRLVTRIATFNGDKVTGVTTYGEPVEVGGVWWPTQEVVHDADGAVVYTTTYEVTARTPDEFAGRLAEELQPREDVLFIELPFVDVDAAKQRVADGSAGFNEHLAVLLHFTLSQQWDRVRERLASIEQLAGEKPLIPWLQAAIWANAGDREPIRQSMLAEAAELAGQPRNDEAAIAERIRSTAYTYTSWPEYAELLQILKPVYERQPAVNGGTRQWQQLWLTTLQQLGRADEALVLLRTMSTEQPWDVELQTQYANHLSSSGDTAAAYAWLDALLNREVPLTQYERASVYYAYEELLRNNGEFDRLVALIEGWVAAAPSENGAEPYARLLSALVYADRVEDAEALLREWVQSARIDGPLPDDVRAKLTAAVAYMLGNAHNLYRYRIDMQWLPLLQETALFHIHRPASFDVVLEIMGNSRFRDTDESDVVLRDILEIVKQEAAERDPTQLRQMTGWLHESAIGIPDQDWAAIAAAVHARWQTAENVHHRHMLGQILVDIYARHERETRYLAFLREQVEQGPDDFRSEYLTALFNALLSAPWSEEIEAEAFALLPRLDEDADARPLEPVAAEDAERQQSVIQRIMAQLAALHRLVDQMVESRYQADMTALQETGHPEELTRQELAEKQAEFRAAAQRAVAERLGQMVAAWLIVDEARSIDAPLTITLETLAEWAILEQLHLQVQLGAELDGVREACWTILGDEPPRIADPPEAPDANDPLATPINWTLDLLDAMRRQRALVTVMNLAARRTAAAEDVERVTAYLDAGIAQGGDDAVLWKQAKYQFLIAVDRPDELAAALRQWIAADQFTAPWRGALARLLAERGELQEAITLLEALERLDELSPADYALLAGWYQVVDRRDDYERSRIAVLQVMEEWQLQQLVQQETQLWRNPDGARGNYVADDALFALRALFEKSSSPGNYLSLQRDLYTASRDMRVLRALPDAMLGRTPQQVYSILESVRVVLNSIENEAGSDEVLARIVELRATTDSPLDLRALDLLEATVERRASEVLNQPGPHIDAAVAAMQRAFERDWADGEPRQMAGWLASLGNINRQALADEQLRELTLLDAQSEPGTDDGLAIAMHLGSTLFAYGRHDEALQRMEIAIREYQQAHPDGWPQQANSDLQTYLNRLQQRRNYAAAEEALVRLSTPAINDGQALWFDDQLGSVYLEALRNDGTVSLGSGETLFINLERHILDACATTDHNHRSQLINRLLSVYRAAADRNIAGAAEHLRQFAFKTLPELLTLQAINYPGLIANTAEALHDVISPLVGLEFLIGRIEQYPQRFEVTHDTAWNQFAHSLERWTQEVQGQVGDLEPRLLAIVLSALREDLLQRESNRPAMYHNDYSYFWGGHEADYLAVAEAVYAERKQSGRSVKYIAQYVWHGLDEKPRAIEMLFVAHRDGLLDDDGQQQLITYLFESGRHAEAAPLLEALVAEHPDSMTYRTQLMVAYFHSERPAQLQELVTQTDAHFRQEGRWTESNMASLAAACVQCRLDEAAIGYWNEVIPLHQRTQPNQGIGNGTLSHYYQQLALAHSRLGHTAEAVDAASSAIVSWGSQQDRRNEAIATLQTVLRDAADLDAYVATLDAKAEESGQDSPVLRKEIGRVHHERNQHAAAARNLELALELSPGDQEIYPLLLKSYDALERKPDAIELLLSQIDIAPHQLSLYSQLAERLADDPLQAERAATSIVEVAPLEAENQQALAELRQTQSRWEDAVPLWRRAAELRSLEPTGLLGLAQAQLQAGQPEAARETLDQLRKQEWPSRFESDLSTRLPELQQRIEAGRP